jgi:hypothetical protein
VNGSSIFGSGRNVVIIPVIIDAAKNSNINTKDGIRIR